MSPPRVAVVGGGPAGLMAAEVLNAGGVPVDLYDAMPSPGRKFLLAGKGGLNLTHAEPAADFLARYGDRQAWVAPWLAAFGPQDLRDWAAGLGIDTFVGSSGRVFPQAMKAAPLLRAWLHRLRAGGVHIHVRHRWLGWDEAGALRFATPSGERRVTVAATVFALGGGSWPQLGSDGAWQPALDAAGIPVVPLKPANCGFTVAWSAHFRGRFAGQPVKTVVARFAGRMRTGEFVVSERGVEGGLIYAFSAELREALARGEVAELRLDLAPGRPLARLTADLAHPRGARSMASHLQSRAGIAGVKAGLLRELAPPDDFADPARLAARLKDLPLPLTAPLPLAEAISSAGGVAFAGLDAGLMATARPGCFFAGEMLDWEAPTGGYLLTACLASGRWAGRQALAWLSNSGGYNQPKAHEPAA